MKDKHIKYQGRKVQQQISTPSVDLLLSVCSFCVVRGGNVGFWVVGIGVVVGAGVVVVVVLVVVVIAKQDKSFLVFFLNMHAFY